MNQTDDYTDLFEETAQFGQTYTNIEMDDPPVSRSFLIHLKNRKLKNKWKIEKKLIGTKVSKARWQMLKWQADWRRNANRQKGLQQGPQHANQNLVTHILASGASLHITNGAIYDKY